MKNPEKSTKGQAAPAEPAHCYLEREIDPSSSLIERCQALEQEIRTYKSWFRAIDKYAPFEIWFKDKDSRYLLVNHEFERAMDKGREELLGKGPEDVFPADRAARLRTVDLRVMGMAEGLSRIIPCDATGVNRTFDEIRFPVYDEDGLVTGLGCVSTEVTGSSKAEETMLRAQSIAKLGSWRWSIKKNSLISCSDEFVQTYGTTREDVFAMMEDRVEKLVHEQDRAAVQGVIRDAYRSGTRYEVEYRIVLPDGTVKHLFEIGEIILGTDNKPAEHVGTVQDVTEMKEAEARLAQAQKMEAVGQLTGGVAHDFNNLLAVIQGNAELLARRGGHDNPLIQAIIRSSTRGAELTHRLLAFSRQQSLQPKPTDLAELVASMTGMLKRTLGATIEIESGPNEGLARVMVDPGQLENALLNLAINARDAMSEGGKLTIECQSCRLDEASVARDPEVTVGDYVVLAVSDNGTGMAAEVVAHAFEPFFTTKGVGKGSGLGLSMVYGFAKQSGGHVTIYSEVDRGTTVKIYLPCAEGELPGEISSRSGESPNGRGETILVVEDDADIRALAVQMLEELHYLPIDVPDVSSADAVLADGTVPDLVLSDVVLPGGASGPEFAERACQAYPDLKVIFMSGYPAEAAKRNGFLGPDKVLLNKPFEMGLLAKAIREALG